MIQHELDDMADIFGVKAIFKGDSMILIICLHMLHTWVPSTHRSGGITYHGNLTKRGSKYLRCIMLECARAHIRTNKNS